jgi:protein-S-isoprenylcysteine O-methyltransferase Ste14
MIFEVLLWVFTLTPNLLTPNLWKEIPDWLSASGTVLIVIAGALAMQKRRVTSAVT